MGFFLRPFLVLSPMRCGVPDRVLVKPFRMRHFTVSANKVVPHCFPHTVLLRYILRGISFPHTRQWSWKGSPSLMCFM